MSLKDLTDLAERPDTEVAHSEGARPRGKATFTDRHNTTRAWALAADIGGTRARFARCELDGSHVTPLLEGLTGDYPNLGAAIAAALNGTVRAPTLVSLAIAAPVIDGVARLTNAHWSFTLDDIKDAAGTERVQMLNDFDALARVLPRLLPSDLHPLMRGNADPLAPCVIVGPGTGLGAAGFINARGRWTALATEGGHMSYGATNESERTVHAFLQGKHGHVSWERVLCGQGLVELLTAFGGGKVDAPCQVTALARAGNPKARQAMDFFTRALGRFAGDAALMLGAKGGVYLAGGIVPKMIDLIDPAVFRQAFIDKGRMTGYLAPIPVNIVTAPDAGLRGAAAALTDLVNEADRVGWAHS